jgi:uncharacterized membrane protein YjgN (DUF898 family)
MQHRFECTLSAHALLPLFFIYHGALVLGSALIVASLIHGPAWSAASVGVPLAAVLVPTGGFIAAVAGLALVHLFYDRTVNALALDGEAFRFESDACAYLKGNLYRLFLTVITAGFYGAWYARYYVSFFVERTHYRGRSFVFGSRPRRLFAIVALTLALPLGGFTALQALSPRLFSAGGGLAATYGVLVYLLGVPFSYLLLKWIVELRWKSSRTYIHAEFPAAIAQILLQHVLTVATAGVYLPAAALSLYRYFVERTAMVGIDVSKRAGFDGSLLRGFGIVWGQLVLSVVTAGVYWPWAYARIVRWLAGHTYLESE